MRHFLKYCNIYAKSTQMLRNFNKGHTTLYLKIRQQRTQFLHFVICFGNNIDVYPTLDIPYTNVTPLS